MPWGQTTESEDVKRSIESLINVLDFVSIEDYEMRGPPCAYASLLCFTKKLKAADIATMAVRLSR